MVANVISILDGAAGSCGKAKLMGEIATDASIVLGATVINCKPNSGHTYIDENGNKIVFRNMPVGIVNPTADLLIGPYCQIDMESFMEEYRRTKLYLGNRKIYVHELASLVEERHRIYEKEHIKSGSTFKGGCAAECEKMLREIDKISFFGKYADFDKIFNGDVVTLDNREWSDMLYYHLDNPNEYVMLEGSQGCDLSLNFNGDFPNTTGRDVSTSALAAMSNISNERILQTIMIIRPYPIRINNVTNDGRFIYTGDIGNGAELTWTDVNLASANGVYAYRGNCPREPFYEMSYHARSILDESINEVLRMYTELPRTYKLQLLNGIEKDILDPNDIDLIMALEIERLHHKCNGVSEYNSIVIEKVSNNGRVFDDSTYRITDISEMTSVTKKERRIFDLDIERLKYNVRANTPSSLYLNFVGQLDSGLNGLTCSYDELRSSYVNFDYIDRYIDWLETSTQTPVSVLGTGAKNNERVLRKSLYRPVRITPSLL